ncbi:MAG: hypothetical protein M1831_005875 [Alyxoria varia]|nr:MAG: hypothetical protein M1831_005875 [Alyxoria varia]
MVVALTLVSLAVFITGYYHYLQDPTFHQNAYGLLTATVLFRSMYVMEVNLRPSLLRREKAHTQQQQTSVISEAERKEQIRIDKRDEDILKNMWIMIVYGLSIFLGGFAIWNIDNDWCMSLTRWRRELGLPWGIVLEGHGWWHIMTGTGAYFYITWGIWLRHCLNGKQDQYELHWPYLIFSLPEIVKKGKLPHLKE